MRGVLEISPRRSGFLRRREASYLPQDGDVHVAAALIERYGLRTGDEIAGRAEPAQGNRSADLSSIDTVNGYAPEELRGRPDFNRLTAVHPRERLPLSLPPGTRGPAVEINRVIDLLCPFGKGQRALIVAPAKAGKTTILQAIAQGIATNHPDATLLILLTDERPEEVSEMEACGFGEVVSSSFDHGADRHVAVAEMTLERARRRAELGEDVVLILDSITRLARAYNTLDTASGSRTLSGGLGASSMDRPKRFFGSARAVDPSQGAGSLTIIATALVDTGSRMDQVIFEEFKGTGNSELTLSRELAERRLYPAIDLAASSTRREENLLPPDELAAAHAIRQRVAGLPPARAMQEVLSLFKGTKTNAELVRQVNAD
ncbi:MAG: transcription termination factor Rho [Gemmatimonadota bacterium]